jgi:hypothetical protein
MLVKRKSMLTGIEHELDIPITQEELDSMKEVQIIPGLISKFTVPGKLMQNAFPHLSPSQREYLMTGSTDEEWKETFREVY